MYATATAFNAVIIYALGFGLVVTQSMRMFLETRRGQRLARVRLVTVDWPYLAFGFGAVAYVVLRIWAAA
jgi:hypothetical protein